MTPSDVVNLVGVLAALVGVLFSLLNSAKREGRAMQRMDDQDKDLAEHKVKLEKHADELSQGRVRFATMETKLDQVLRQQEHMIETLDTLASRKDLRQ